MYAVFKGLLHKLIQPVRAVFLAVLPYLVPILACAQENGGGGGGGIGEWLTSAASWLTSPFTLVIAQVMQWLFFLVNWITGILGQIMNWTIEFLILNMSEKINQITAIDSLWQILRDLGNIIFIFLILYAAISTILGSNEHSVRKLLPRIIVVALLVNFSLFVTQIVIDTSNVFALQIYENISVSGVGDGSSVNISNAIAGQLNLSTIMGDSATEWFSGDFENGRVAVLRAIGTAVVGILGFIFLAFAALITIRFFVLILVMIASPIAFIAFALPDVEFGETWMNYLISQSFFAPAMMLMLYLTLYLGKSMKSSGAFADGDISKAISEPSGNIDILIFYALMVGMLLASLIVARRIGAVGADKAIGGTAAAYGWAGRQTIGRAGNAIRNNRYLKEKATDKDASAVSRYLAQKTLKGGQKTADASFDVRNTGVASAVDKEGGSLDSSFGQRDDGYKGIREEQREFLREQRKDLEEMTPAEKERAAKAKAKKKELEEEKEDAEENLSDVNSLENKKNSQLNNLAEAIDNDNVQKGVQALKQLKSIEEEAKEKDEIDKLFKEDLDQLAKKLRSENGFNSNSITGLQELSETSDMTKTKKQYKKTKKKHKKAKKKLDRIIKVGQERGERFQEILSEQQSNLDYIAKQINLDEAASRGEELANQVSNRLGGDDIFLDPDTIRFTSRTQSFRDVAAEDIEKIDNIGDDNRRQRITDNLQGNI